MSQKMGSKLKNMNNEIISGDLFCATGVTQELVTGIKKKKKFI